jgi:rare lipoprotein A
MLVRAPLVWQPMAPRLVAALLLALLALRAGAQEADGAPPAAVEAAQSTDAEFARGKASWYGRRFHGRRTSSGERFDMHDLTAAHDTLPFGTRVRVRNVANGREVVVRINDRSAGMRDRIIDLSKAAAAALGFLKAGEAPVVLIAP